MSVCPTHARMAHLAVTYKPALNVTARLVIQVIVVKWMLTNVIQIRKPIISFKLFIILTQWYKLGVRMVELALTVLVTLPVNVHLALKDTNAS